jgi:hypothetical protein
VVVVGKFWKSIFLQKFRQSTFIAALANFRADLNSSSFCFLGKQSLKHVRKLAIIPIGNVIKGIHRVFAQDALDGVTVVVEDNNNRLKAETNHAAYFLSGELQRTFPSNQKKAFVSGGDSDTESGRSCPSY